MQILHTMLRVTNLKRSIEFYRHILGMQLLRSQDNEQYRYTLAFLGYKPESEQAVIELTYNWDKQEYDLGNAYGHIAIGVSDLYGTVEKIRQAGGKIAREPGPVAGGKTEIAFVRDPDGYSIELIAKDYINQGLSN